MRPAARRRRWLNERAEVGRTRPRSLSVLLVNAASVSVRPERAERIWRRAVEVGADVILACEMADVDATPTPGYEVVQARPVGSPDSALVIAVREDRGHTIRPRLLPGSPATSEGGGIRRRPILRARVLVDPGTPRRWSRTFAVEHAPPGRAPVAREDYLRSVDAAAIVGGDLNVGRRWALRLFGGKRVHSAGVLHLAAPRWIPQTRARRIDVGSDHPAVLVTLWPNQLKENP